MDSAPVQRARDLTCSLCAILVRRARAAGGEPAVRDLLRRAGSSRSPAYLEDVGNWISHDEAIALFDAAAEMTQDPLIGRRVGEEAVRQHAGTNVATLLRSLGSPEEVFRQITLTVTKFSTITDMEPLESERGRAVVRSRARPGFVRHRHLCNWTKGLLSQPTVLFGLPAALVEESECQAAGGRHCLYTVTWDPELADRARDPQEQVVLLEAQLSAALRQLDDVYATARELVSSEDLESVLATVTARAATAVRAPRYVLAVRPAPEDDVRCHGSGMSESETEALAERLLAASLDALPASWLVVDVVSDRRHYGRLAAMYPGDIRFLPQERDLLQTYARLAAAVLDSATALRESRRRHDESRALLSLARALAVAGTSQEVAERLGSAVPDVVDCDTVGVFLWDESVGMLRCRATFGATDEQAVRLRATEIGTKDTPHLQRLLADADSEPMYFEADSADPYVGGLMRELGNTAALVIPIVVHHEFLGILNVAVRSRRERLRPTPYLLELLQGVAAQAATAIENGRLVDRMAHHAAHDALTGLANRMRFAERGELQLDAARRSNENLALVFADLDGFKTINDELGHATGDELLREVADRLATTARAGDTLARLGGDEFAVLLPGAGRAEAEALAQRVAHAFASPFTVAGHERDVHVSVGVAVFPEDAEGLAGLLSGADAAMYDAKRAARRRTGSRQAA
jgi:diguanylate cyclase (GGDEF)-like protein